jgi:hypothetical protein
VPFAANAAVDADDGLGVLAAEDAVGVVLERERSRARVLWEVRLCDERDPLLVELGDDRRAEPCEVRDEGGRYVGVDVAEPFDDGAPRGDLFGLADPEVRLVVADGFLWTAGDRFVFPDAEADPERVAGVAQSRRKRKVEVGGLERDRGDAARVAERGQGDRVARAKGCPAVP